MALRGSTDVSIHDIKEGFDVEKLKANVAKAYLTYHEIPDVGLKHELHHRIRDHIRYRKCGTLKDSYPPSSFVLPCDGVVCPDDVILFKTSLNSMVAARVLSVSRQCRNFTLEVLWSEGMTTYRAFHHYSFPWKKIRLLPSTRQPVEDEDLRKRNATSIQSQFQRLVEQEKASNLARKPPERIRRKTKNSTVHSRDDGAGPSTAIVPHVEQKDETINADSTTPEYPSSSDELQDEEVLDTGRVLEPEDRQPVLQCLEVERRNEVEKRKRDQEAENMDEGRVRDCDDSGEVVQNLEGEERSNQDAEKAAQASQQFRRGKRRRRDQEAKNGNGMFTEHSEPIAQNLKDKGRRKNLAESEARSEVLVVGDEKTTTNQKSKSGKIMYTGRVLIFDDNERAVEAEGRGRNEEAKSEFPQMVKKRKRDKENNNESDMYTGRNLSFGDNVRVLQNVDAEAEGPRQSPGKRRKREKKSGSEMYTGRLLYFDDNEPVVHNFEAGGRIQEVEVPPKSGKKKKPSKELKDVTEMYTGRVINFGDSEPVQGVRRKQASECS